MNRRKFNINNNIIKIQIIEKIDKVFFSTNNGEKYEESLVKILRDKSKIYNNLKIRQKCKELTSNIFQLKILERKLNPIIIYALNDNNEIYKYINCIKENKRLPFLLEHDRRESSLGFFKRRVMKRVLKSERKLGAIIKEDKSFFEKIIKEKEIKKDFKLEIDKKYNNAIFLLNNAKENKIYYGSKELTDIEKDIKECAIWYMNKRKYEEAKLCIDKLKFLLNDENERYYKLIAKRELEKGNVKDFKEITKMYLLKKYNLEQLLIRNEYMNGNKKYAKELYKNLLKRLEIKLNKRELRKSLSKGIIDGVYFKENILTGNFEKINIIGDEQLREIIENSKEININNVSKKEVLFKKLSKDEINNIINKSNKMDNITKYQKGAIIPIIDNLINYLKENDDSDVKNFLYDILNEFDNIPAINLLSENIGRKAKYSVLIFDYISGLYKDGVLGKDKEIISKDNNRYCYYTYILNRKIDENKNGSIHINQQRLDKIKKYYNENSEKIEREYFEKLKEQNLKKETSLYKKLKTSEEYSKAIQDLGLSTKNDDIKLLTLKEDMKNGVYRRTIGSYTNKKEFDIIFNDMMDRFNKGEQFSQEALKDLGDICFEGIKDDFGNIIIEPKINLAKKLYSKILNNKNAYSRLLNIYKSELDPIKDKRKIKQINIIMKQNGIKIENNNKDVTNQKEYVCSDLHGQYEVYKDIIDKIGENDKLYILGDVIDRGPDGMKILQDIAKRQENGQVEFFVGNHEYMMIQALFLGNSEVEKIWTSESNGGKKTKEEFEKLPDQEKNKIRNLLLNSLVYKEINVDHEKLYLVHAKAIQNANKEKESVKDFLETGRQKELEMAVWTRKGDQKTDQSGEVWKDEEIGKSDVYSIIGHTPTNGMIEISKGYVNIDCGASYFGNECLLRINDGKIVYFDNFERCEQQMENEKEETR